MLGYGVGLGGLRPHGTVLVPETQHTQAPRQAAPVQPSVFVPETQMPPVASAPQQANAAPAAATNAHAAMGSRERGAVLVPETQGSVAIGCVSPFCVNSCERNKSS